MKRFCYIAILFCTCMAVMSFQQQPKLLKVELTLDQWQKVVNTIDNSTSPHTDVKTVTGWIIPQLNKQIKDTTIKK